MSKHTLRPFVNALFSLIALVILADFALPGSIKSNEIIDLKKERQQYYNAARNYHYSYKVITNEHQILVSEDFAKIELIHKEIEYAISPLFKEVNWYRLLSTTNKSFYSLRIASGLALPLLTIISIFLIVRYKMRMGSIVFILQVLLLADLIFLIT